MSISFKELEKKITDLFLIADEGVIRLLCATVIANRLPGKPAWLFLIAGSGGGKTELISLLNKVEKVIPLDTLTANTFISGQKRQGKETSLLHKYGGGIFTFKDLTIMIAQNKDEKVAIFGQMRGIYDGDLNKAFGTGEEVKWTGKYGVIAGVTSKIYLEQQLYSSMGERFVMYAPLMPPGKVMAKRAIKNEATLSAKKTVLQDLMQEYLDETIGFPEKAPDLSEELIDEIINLAEVSCFARSAVERNWHSREHEITMVHFPELPTRFSTQLATLMQSFMIMEGAITDLHKRIIYKIALDSIPRTRRMCLQELLRAEEAEAKGIAIKINLPTDTVRWHLQDLNAIGIVERRGGSQSDRWRIKDETRKVLEKHEGISKIISVLNEQYAEQYRETLLDKIEEGIGEIELDLPEVKEEQGEIEF